MSRGQRFLLFCLIFFGTAGIFQVDAAYSDMMDQEGLISVAVRRVDTEHIKLLYFGETREIDVRDAQERLSAARQQAESTAAAALDMAERSISSVLHAFRADEEEEPDVRQAVFPVQTL